MEWNWPRGRSNWTDIQRSEVDDLLVIFQEISIGYFDLTFHYLPFVHTFWRQHLVIARSLMFITAVWFKLLKMIPMNHWILFCSFCFLFDLVYCSIETLTLAIAFIAARYFYCESKILFFPLILLAVNQTKPEIDLQIKNAVPWIIKIVTLLISLGPRVKWTHI